MKEDYYIILMDQNTTFGRNMCSIQALQIYKLKDKKMKLILNLNKHVLHHSIYFEIKLIQNI